MHTSPTHTDVFVSRIWTFDLSELTLHHSEWITALHTLRKTSPSPELRSMRRGWRTDRNLLQHKLFKPLEDACLECFNYCFNELKAGEFNYKLEAWANVGDNGAYNVQHGHARTYLSAVYYITAQPGSGDLYFHEPRPASTYGFLAPCAPFGSQPTAVSPIAGKLVVFPAWLEHSVSENHSGQTRISIPMNAIPSANTAASPKFNQTLTTGKAKTIISGKIR